MVLRERYGSLHVITSKRNSHFSFEDWFSVATEWESDSWLEAENFPINENSVQFPLTTPSLTI